MTHEAARQRLPDLLFDRNDAALLAHLRACHDCQRQFFLLARIDRLLRQRAAKVRRRARLRQAVATTATIAAAAVAVVALMLPRNQPAPLAFALRGVDGSVVAHAQLRPADAENQSIAFVTEGLPTAPTDTYLLWTSSSGTKRPLLVGRFMVNHTGACRTRFNLAGTRRPSHFWITPSTDPAVVVAGT
jgi:anti-sigma-K factor RskA